MLELKERLRSHLREIVRERDVYLATAGHFYVQQYIRQQLSQWGPVETHEFKSQGQTHQNLILNLPGRSSKPPILIGAHYDAVPGSPGADDNATGVAVLLEFARSFSLEPARHPIRLVAFDLEETIYDLAGSTHYANDLNGEPLRLMLSLEMLGYCTSAPNSQRYPLDALRSLYPDRGNFIGLIGNAKTLLDLIRLHSRIRGKVPCAWMPLPNRGRILPDTRRSDHAVFWDLGYRAIMITDTSYLRNPHYHKPSDQLETLDLEFLTRVCEGLAIGVRSL